MERTESTKWYIGAAFVVGVCAMLAFSLPSDASADTVVGNKKHKHATTTTVNLSCVQDAVADRETSILASYEKHFTAMKTALTDRKTALNTAWGKTDAKERRTAIKNVWKEFRTDKAASHKLLIKERKAAWKTYRDTMKTECKEKVPAEESEVNDTII